MKSPYFSLSQNWHAVYEPFSKQDHLVIYSVALREPNPVVGRAIDLALGIGEEQRQLIKALINLHAGHFWGGIGGTIA